MQYKFIRKPFMLLETVGMLHKYINDIKAAETVKYRFPAVDDVERKRREDCLQRMHRVQEIIDTVCADVDRDDPMMVRFFGRVDCGCEYTCLAQLLTFSFCTLEHPGFRDHVEDICRKWKELQERGCWIHSSSGMVFIFTDEPDSPGNLIRQVKALNYPGDFRMELCEALDSFEETMHCLADLIEPLSIRLERIFQDEPQYFIQMGDYWEEVVQTRKSIPLLVNMGFAEDAWDDEQVLLLALSYLNTNISCSMGRNSCVLKRDYNAIYLGSALSPNSLSIRKGVEWDGVSALLKCLGDSKRLEMLRRLTKERSYGLALAEAMGMDQGNVSRNLGMLFHYGMLKQEREVHRTYYRTDTEALHEFLVRVEQLIHS